MFPLDLKKQAVKSSLVEVPKVWGKEYWVANCDEYCGKLLILNKGAESSYHYHKIKKETFYCLDGQVALTIDGKDYMLNPFARPKTIFPNTKHSFWGITDAIILEVSTHHEDEDVVRLTESKEAPMKNCPKCKQAMIRASNYDPDGAIALCGGIRSGEDWWVCINPECEDGKKNVC